MNLLLVSRVPILALLLPFVLLSHASFSTKRGLCFTPSKTTPQDNHLWAQQPSDLTWYYNYRSEPSNCLGTQTQEEFEFVPMFWPPKNQGQESTFVDKVQGFIHQGCNITHVFTFNEPEMSWQWGGANMDPRVGARLWSSNIPRLQSMGIKAGLPATAGTSTSLAWLE